MSQYLLSIENERAKGFSQDYLIDLFAESESRKMIFNIYDVRSSWSTGT